MLIREDLSRYPIAEDVLHTIIKAHQNWAKELAERGIFIAGNEMPEEGKIVEWVDGKIIVSPLRDVKEGIGGFYIIQAENFDAAVAIAAGMSNFFGWR